MPGTGCSLEMTSDVNKRCDVMQNLCQSSVYLHFVH